LTSRSSPARIGGAGEPVPVTLLSAHETCCSAVLFDISRPADASEMFTGDNGWVGVGVDEDAVGGRALLAR
jgi:hypothetical protein